MQGHKLGRLQPAPKSFRPTADFIRGNYRYKVDIEQGLVLRIPLLPGDALGKAYFSLVSVQKSKRRSWALKLPKLALGKLATAGTALFVAGGVLIAYPLYPAVQYEVSQKVGAPIPLLQAAKEDPISKVNVLKIPKIGLTTDILEGPSLKILDKKEGVWHQRGDLSSNFVLAGHRWKYLPPNVSTFYNLNKLEKGDTIVIDWYEKRYVYVVTEQKVVQQTEDQVLEPTPGRQLTLYTCNDRKETERVVVIAEPLE